MFDISPCEEVGDFEIKAKFMGVEMEKVQLHFQVNPCETLEYVCCQRILVFLINLIRKGQIAALK